MRAFLDPAKHLMKPGWVIIPLMPRLLTYCALTLIVLVALAPAQTAPKPAGRTKANVVTLSNAAISATWSIRGDQLRAQSLTNHFTGAHLPLDGNVFELLTKEGAPLASSAFKIVGEPVMRDLAPAPRSPKGDDQLTGHELRVVLEDSSGNVRVVWSAVLRDGANYLRQMITVRALHRPVALTGITLIDAVVPGAAVSGHVKGSPVTTKGWFLGFEHPLSECRVRADRATCWLARELPLQPGLAVSYSSVIGVAHPTQLRRDFLRYIELERAHPYHTFLHYNSWYDLGYFDRYTEQQAVDVVNAFGEQLTKKRGVMLDSFLFDDGWDDPTNLWKFSPGFPDGFTKVTEAAAQFNAAPGIWLSPWGGYEKPKEQRLVSARAQGYETNDGGLALSGPKYYRYFRDTCLDLIAKYNINQFKFDGTGNVNEVIKGSEFDSDFDAAIHLIGELRAKKPDLYINLTTGTYPSPFWLLYADSIWRGGDDHSFTGVGTDRQRWITYRDSQLYRWVIEDGPLFPMNSLMLHGLIYARYAERLGNDPGHDFADEVHSYFGTGTQLQEMYITPSLLTSDDWDTLAEAAKWSRDNAATLKDSHWIGGDPARLEVYGYASWSNESASNESGSKGNAHKKAIVTLRNPSDQPQDFTASLSALLELPPGAPRSYRGHSPWKSDSARPTVTIPSSEAHRFHLKPFEVLTLELAPVP